MITASVENVVERINDLKNMFPVHAKELDTYSDRRPLDPKYDEYLQRDAQGGVLLVIVRENGNIIGYFVGFIQPALHYQSTLTCLQDIFYVLPDNRTGSAKTSLKMFRCVIDECKRRGVKEIRGGHKIEHDAAALFLYFGFKPVETIYSLWIGAENA